MDNSYSHLPGPPPELRSDLDLEWAEYVAWADREAAAGRVPEPEPWVVDEWEPWDPELDDPAVGRPEYAASESAGLPGDGPGRPLFAEDGAADVMPPSPFLAAAEFGRRRQAAFSGALAAGVPAGCAPGGFPGEELAIELAVSRAEAGHLIDDAIDLTARLPRTLAGMAAGLVDAGRAGWIALYTRSLTPADAAMASR